MFTAGSPLPASPASCGRCARSSRTASESRPSRSPTCSTCNGRGSSSVTPAPARSSFAPAASGWRRSSSTPSQVEALRERLPEVIYEWREQTVVLPVPDEPGARLGAVTALADGLGAARALPAAA